MGALAIAGASGNSGIVQRVGAPRSFRILPDPTLYPTSSPIGFGGTTYVTNGTAFVSSPGGVPAPSPYHPTGATVVIDFENDYYYWNGAVRQKADMTVNTAHPTEGYSISYPNIVGATHTVMLDWVRDQTIDANGCLFDLSNGGGVREEYSLDSGFPRGSVFMVYTSQKHPPLQYQGSTDVAGGRQRTIFSVTNTKVVLALNGSPALTQTVAAGTHSTAPNRLSIGFRGAFGSAGQIPSRQEIKRLVIFPEFFEGEALLDLQTNTPDGRGLAFIGDSLTNSDGLFAYLNGSTFVAQQSSAIGWRVSGLLLDRYRAMSVDGAGGTTLAMQNIRNANAAWNGGRNRVLIIVDAIELTTQEALDAINAMVARMGHDNWLYVEPPYKVGSTQVIVDFRVQQRQTMLAFKELFGNHFVETEPTFRSLATASPADQDALANWYTPPSLLVDDIHYNSLGYNTVAGLIADAVQAAGY